MLFRTITTLVPVLSSLLLAVSSYAADWQQKCRDMEDYTEHNHLQNACKDFFSQGKDYSDYEPHSVHESADLSADVKAIIEGTKSKRIVIFLPDYGYISYGTIDIKDRDLAFVGVNNNLSTQSHIALFEPPADAHSKTEKHEALIRFNSPGKQFMFKNIILSDVNTHFSKPAPESTQPTVHGSLIDIESAHRVIIDSSWLESHYHEDALHLGCSSTDWRHYTDLRLTNSVLKIPAESAHAVHFDCKKRGFNYDAQLALLTFGFNTAPVMSKDTPSSPADRADSTASLSSPTITPYTDSMIYVDVEGKVRFLKSPCNRLKYTDKDSIEHKVPLDKALFVTYTAGFDGLFAITESNSMSGTYFTHKKGTNKILVDTFTLTEQCPVVLDSDKELSNFLPGKALVQNQQGGPQASTDDGTDWKSKYDSQKTRTTVAGVFAGVTALAAVILAVCTCRYRRQRAIHD